MNSVVLLFLLAICAYVESGYIYFGPGNCLDSAGEYYDLYFNASVIVGIPDECLEKCEITPSFVGFDMPGVEQCICRYDNGTTLWVDDSNFQGDAIGTGPVSSADGDEAYSCHKYIDENGLEFHRDFVFNSSAASFELSAEVGEFYTNLTSNGQYKTEMTLYGWNASATLINETLCGSNATTKLTPDRAKAISELDNSIVSASSTTFSQDFELNLTDIATSDLYVRNSDSDTEGKIIFCARMDIMDNNTGLGFFAETFLTLLVNMTADFTIASVTAERFDPTEQDAEASFDVDACICESDGTCLDEEVVSQNSDFNVCIWSKSNGVVVETVKEMAIYQDDEEKFSPVSGGSPSNTLTKINPYNENGKRVTTRAISSFFTKVPPSPLRITGSVDLGFVSARRLLEDNVFATGEEDDEIPTASFELSVGLKPLTDDTEEIDTNEGEGEEEDVVIEEQEDDEGIANKGKSGSSVPVNVIVGVVGAVVCSLILAVGLRRAGSRSGAGVEVEYDGLKGSV